MKTGDLLERIEKLYRDYVLTAAEVGRFRDEFSRLQDKADRITGEQHEMRGRLAVLESRTAELHGVRDRVIELEARFRTTLDQALMSCARDAVAQQTQEYLAKQSASSYGLGSPKVHSPDNT